MNANKTDLGHMGEDMAAQHLVKNGYHILTTNYRNKTGEIDIIARDGDILCFIEVKLRTNIDQGHPLEAITPYKQRRLSLTALGYLQENELIEQVDGRFDVVAIERVSTTFSVEIYKNAFESVY